MTQLHNGKLYVNTLSFDELNLFTSIHHQLIPERKTKFMTRTVSSAGKNVEKIKMIQPILQKAINILTSNGITNFNKTNFIVECHQRNCGFEKKKYQWSHWHTDDYGATSYLVYTILFYLRKDKTVQGGDLDYKISQSVYTHKVKSRDIVQFKGDLKHKPCATCGFGCRDIIVVFIKRTL